MHEQWLAYHGVMDNFWLAAAWSLLPTVGVSIVFFFVVRGILRFDLRVPGKMIVRLPRAPGEAIAPAAPPPQEG